MQLWRGLYNVPKQFTGCVASIGNFDGMHLGHQALVKALSTEAKALCLPSLVIIFEPQPKEFFAPAKAPARIANFREKVKAFESFGVDYVLCLPFNQSRSEEHTSELQSRPHLVCRLLLEKKKK